MDDFGSDINSFKDKLVYVVWDVVPYSSYVNAYDYMPLQQEEKIWSYLLQSALDISNVRHKN